MYEIKFIIVKDRRTSQLRHFKSDWLSHDTIARDNGFAYAEVLEAGIFVDKKLYILDCLDRRHGERRKNYFADNRNIFYSNLWLKAREAESLLKYKYAGLRQGD